MTFHCNPCECGGHPDCPDCRFRDSLAEISFEIEVLSEDLLIMAHVTDQLFTGEFQKRRETIASFLTATDEQIDRSFDAYR